MNLLVISRMAGARNEQHSVQTISAVNLEEGGEKRKNNPAGLNCKKFDQIYRDLLNGTVDSQNRSIPRHVRTTFQILFKSSICFACTATKSERMNGCGLSLVVPLCITLSGSEFLSNRLSKLGGFCLAFRWNGDGKHCSTLVAGDIV